MARLVVTHCTTCRAPLELDPAGGVEVRCPFCGATNRIAPVTPPPADATASGRGGRMMLGALVGGLGLFVGGAVLLGWWWESDDADRVDELGAFEALGSLRGIGADRAAMLPDGSLWVACRYDLLCALDSRGRWLGSVALPFVADGADEGSLRHGPTRAMAGDRAGRLYVSRGEDLLEISTAERRIVGPVRALPPGERAHCLAVAPDDSLFMVTSADDVVQLDASRAVRARWRQPLLAHDARHHGCDTIVVDTVGQVWVSAGAAPAIYVLSPTGELLRRHAPGGSGHYVGLAVLADGRAVAGYYDRLVVWDAGFAEGVGPKTSQRPGWGWVTEVLRAPDDALVVTTQLGQVARWERASQRWR